MVNRGIKTEVFKPRSGHNFWYQYDASLECKKEEKLFCEDIIKLKKACRSPLPAEILNPVDALMSPLNVKEFLKRNTINMLYLLEQDTFLHMIAERYTIISRNGTQNILCINKRSLESRFVIIDLEYVLRLEKSVDRVLYINSLEEWNNTFTYHAPKAISSCYRKVSEKADYVIVEGFNDAVCPEKSLRYDLVIGVAPGVSIFYDGEAFHEVLGTLESLGKDPRSLRAVDVLKYLKKKKTLPIPALPSSHLKDYDRLSEKLASLVDLALKLTDRF